MFLNEVEEILDRIQSAHLTGESEMELFKRIAACINSPHFQVSERAIYILNNDIIVRFVSAKREVLIPVLARALIGNTYMADERENEPPVGEQVTQLVDQLMQKMRATKAHSNQQQLHQADDSGTSSDELVSPYPLSPLLLSPHSLHLGHASQGRPGHWNATIVELTSDIIKLLAEMDGALVDKLLEDREREVQERVRKGEDRVRRWGELRRLKRQWEQERGKLSADAAGGAEDSSSSSSPTSSSSGLSAGVPIEVGGGSGAGAMEQ